MDTTALCHQIDTLTAEAMAGAPDASIKLGARMAALAITGGYTVETALVTSMVKMLISDVLASEPGEGMTTEAIVAELLAAHQQLTLPKSDPACDWESHDDAMDEHGYCPVCQH